MSGPLAGVRVVEISSVLSGPLAAALLAEQGAEVVKVEPPGGGDLQCTPCMDLAAHVRHVGNGRRQGRWRHGGGQGLAAFEQRADFQQRARGERLALMRERGFGTTGLRHDQSAAGGGDGQRGGQHAVHRAQLAGEA